MSPPCEYACCAIDCTAPVECANNSTRSTSAHCLYRTVLEVHSPWLLSHAASHVNGHLCATPVRDTQPKPLLQRVCYNVQHTAYNQHATHNYTSNTQQHSMQHTPYDITIQHEVRLTTVHGTQACSRLELWAHAGLSTQRYSEYSLQPLLVRSSQHRYHYPDDDSEGPWDPLHLHFRDVTDVFIVFRFGWPTAAVESPRLCCHRCAPTKPATARAIASATDTGPAVAVVSAAHRATLRGQPWAKLTTDSAAAATGRSTHSLTHSRHGTVSTCGSQ